MSEPFHTQKLNECLQEFRTHLMSVRISDDLLEGMRRRFEVGFRRVLTDDASTTNRFGEAAWKKTGDAVKIQARRAAALAEYYAREDNVSEIHEDHLNRALNEVSQTCPVGRESMAKRRFIYCDIPY
jgi:hypothetical protein